MQLYHRAQIATAVTLDERALAAIEAGFAALGRGDVIQPPIMSMEIAESHGEVDVKTAHITGSTRFAIKVSPGFFDNPKLGLPSLNGLMIVFSAKTGRVDSVLFDEGYLTDIRTALAGAIAAKYLSRPDSQRVTVLGAGIQAELQIAALRLVRPIEVLDVWARNRTKAEDYASRMRERYGLDVHVHDDIRTACKAADIIVTTTPSREPLLFANDLPDGVHVTAMGSDSSYKRELDQSALEHANVFVADIRAQSEKNGELKVYTHTTPSITPPFEVQELGSIVANGVSPRTSDTQITVCDLTGTGVQDTAIAGFALERLTTLTITPHDDTAHPPMQ